MVRESIDNLGDTDTADLLVESEAVVDGDLRVAAQKLWRKGKSHGDETFHIANTTAEKLAVLFRQLPRIDRPCLTVHRHHIGMAGKHDTCPVLGAYGCKQARLLFIVIKEKNAVDAQSSEVALYILDQGQVGIAADRR